MTFFDTFINESSPRRALGPGQSDGVGGAGPVGDEMGGSVEGELRSGPELGASGVELRLEPLDDR